MRSHRRWSDILAQWGLVNRPHQWKTLHRCWRAVCVENAVKQWLQRSKLLVVIDYTSWSHGMPTSVPSNISCTYPVRKIPADNAESSSVILTRKSHIIILSTSISQHHPKSCKFSILFTETKTFILRPRLYFLSSRRLDRSRGLHHWIQHWFSTFWQVFRVHLIVTRNRLLYCAFKTNKIARWEFKTKTKLSATLQLKYGYRPKTKLQIK